ncbi:MAG TPA: sn-glycerol-3-phosphate ABC transporter ATP-binding protein UgpC [Dongiaceae bacterium]|nr:sn-glycerol-3-phosphate ABC transporter ATP-binding protein UgpC [Dongiaceae bacterium]
MASVEIRDVYKAFGAVRILHGIDVDIADGEFVVLVGPSGCGKSTLLRTIAGLEAVTGGEIRIGGRAVNNLPPKERDVAMVFQNYALYPHMTVFDNMAFSLKLRRADTAVTDKRVREAADILGLVPFLERYPRQLSGGQRQRVAMGRAIVRDPQVFLFDEPLSNLDAKLRVQMRTEIKALHQRLKTTSIYVTHDQIEAMTLADRIVVMHDGRIEQIGAPLDLYDRPANLFVAGFIGSPTMNVLSGTLRRSNGAAWVETGNNLRLPLSPAGSCGGPTGDLPVAPTPSSSWRGPHPALMRSPLCASKRCTALSCGIRRIGWPGAKPWRSRKRQQSGEPSKRTKTRTSMPVCSTTSTLPASASGASDRVKCSGRTP